MTQSPEDSRPRYSVSQYNAFADPDKGCPWKWHLEKREKVWQRPAAWLPQGTAVHAALEEWERSGRTLSLQQIQDVFRRVYAEEVNGMLGVTPNLDYWFQSGPYDGEADIARRFRIGLEQVERLHRFLTQRPEAIWVDDDGNPGIEKSFELELDGLIVRGYIDRITALDIRELLVDDLKTGNSPGGPFQLGTYKVAIEDEYPDVKVIGGRYLMAGKRGARNAKYEQFDITEFTKESLSERFHRMDDEIRKGNIPAKPTPDKCRFCSVSYACEFAFKD